jgi:hypothetical protein
LDCFLGKMDSKPMRLGGSASVAGDQIAVSKDSSLTGEVYVRADGKKGKSSCSRLVGNVFPVRAVPISSLYF